MEPTGHPAVLGDLVRAIERALGAELIGIYLYGSLVTGGFDANASDIDLVAVTRSDAGRLEVEPLRQLHDAVVSVHTEWTDRIEVVYVGIGTLGSWQDRGRVAVVSPGEPLHIVEGADRYVQNWYLVRATSAALTGPPPEQVFPEIASDVFVAAVARYAQELAARPIASMNPGARAYSVLTMCRALRTVASGAPCSKQDGAAWTRQRHPEWARLIDAALEARSHRRDAGFEDRRAVDQVESFVRLLADEIRAISEGRLRR